MKKTSKVVSAVLVLALTFSLVACTVDQVLSDINLLIQTAAAIGSAVGAVSPVDSAAIQKAVDVATAGLNVIQADYDAYEKSGAATDLQKLQAAIGALRSNLPAELAAAHVSNPVATARVTNWVNLIVSTLDAIIAILPRLTPKGKMGAEAAALLPTANALQARWKTEVCGNDPACGQMVKAKAVRR